MNTGIKVISTKISREELKKMATEGFGDMVKAVVDVEKRLVALGGELHADAEAVLLDNGSQQRDLWGINLYPDNSPEELIEFSSLINIRPSRNNRSVIIQDEAVKEKIIEIINSLL